MTAIGVIIILTQILPSIGYNPKNDTEYVNQFKPQAEEIILKNILKEGAGEGISVLENFEETIRRAKKITAESILRESRTLAAKEASGTIGALKTLPRALKHINLLEFCCLLGLLL